MEQKGAVTFKGAPLTLVGELLKSGQNVLDAELVDNDMNIVKLSKYDGKVRIITTVPSLDTPVCDLMSKRFNEEASKLGSDVAVLVVSMDLPFAQKRWCGNLHKSATALSCYRSEKFGVDFGILIKELHLLARACFVIDKKGVVRLVHLVKEITEEPKYDEVLKAAKEALNS